MTTTAPAPVTATDTLLDFRNVEMTFPNGTIALQGVDLTVDRGQFVSVVGPSGCGKSTLLRIASGLETASDGTAGVTADRIGYVFQDATLLPWRSVQGNVEAPRRGSGTCRRPSGRRRRRTRSTWSG